MMRRHEGCTKVGHIGPKGHEGSWVHGFIWETESAKGHDDSFGHGFEKGHDSHKGCDGL
jgi:hypothetical protein